jgi:hypothetical protein
VTDVGKIGEDSPVYPDGQSDSIDP